MLLVFSHLASTGVLLFFCLLCSLCFSLDRFWKKNFPPLLAQTLRSKSAFLLDLQNTPSWEDITSTAARRQSAFATSSPTRSWRKSIYSNKPAGRNWSGRKSPWRVSTRVSEVSGRRIMVIWRWFEVGAGDFSSVFFFVKIIAHHQSWSFFLVIKGLGCAWFSVYYICMSILLSIGPRLSWKKSSEIWVLSTFQSLQAETRLLFRPSKYPRTDSTLQLCGDEVESWLDIDIALLKME